MVIDPQKLASYSAYDLLTAATLGRVGIDQRWLHALIDDPAKSLPDIVRFAAEEHPDERVPLEQDLISIFQYFKTPLAIPYYLDLIRRDPSEIPDEVVEAIVVIGHPAIQPLLKLYEEIGPDEAGELAFLLAGMNIHDPRILKVLLDRLDVDWDDALFHLEVYRDPAAIPELERRAKTAEGEHKLDLADTIKDLGEERPQTIITDFDIWSLYPDEAGPEFEVLSEEERLEFLTEGTVVQRADAATSFFSEDFSVSARAKLLESARTDPSVEVRSCCWEAFFDQTEDPELRNVLMARLVAPETPLVERAGVALGLARHTDQQAVAEAILELAEDPETRERALEAIWRSFDPSFADEAAKYLDDPNVEVRRNAIWAVGYLQVTRDAALLKPFFDDEELRPDALHNYALVAPGPTTRKKIPELYENISELAKGFTEAEGDAVKAGLDVRLVRAGLKTVYQNEEAEEPQMKPAGKTGRNDPCPCGSGKKFKKCCGQ